MALTPTLIVHMPAPAMRGDAPINVNIDLVMHDPVRVVATSVGNFSTDLDNNSIVDDITLVTGDHILYQPVTGGIAQSNVQVGIYVVQASGAPVRRVTEDVGAEIHKAAVRVLAGTQYGGSAWVNVNSTVPNVGTDPIIFRLYDAAGGAGAPAAMLPHAGSFASYSAAADVVVTAGYASDVDGGGSTWKRRTTTPPSGPAAFRRADAGGVYYEASRKRVIHGEQVGIFGDGSDVGAIINEVLTYLAANGGGKLILPPGVVHSSVDLVCDGSGITIEGASTSNVGLTEGTTLSLASGKTFFLGGAAAGVDRYQIKVSDLAIQQDAASNVYFFTSRKVRGLHFDNIQIGSGVFGFHEAGQTGAFSRFIFYTRIEGNLRSSTGGNFLLGTYCGTFYMQRVIVEGAGSEATISTNSAFIGFPSSALQSPDGVIISDCGAGMFDRGIFISRGLGNLLVTNSWLDRMKTSSLVLNPLTGNSCAGIRFNNCHFAGALAHLAATQIGIDIKEINGGTVRRVEISDSHIVNWGANGIRLEDACEQVGLFNNHIESVARHLNNTYAAVLVDDTCAHIKIENNQIYSTEAFKPAIGVNILTTAPTISCRFNSISDLAAGSTAYINNPNRGGARFKKVSENTGQVLEGKTATFSGWVITQAIQTTTNTPMSFADWNSLGISGAPGTVGNSIVAQARGKIIGTWMRGIGNKISGTLNCRPSINGNPQSTPVAVVPNGSNQSGHAEDLDGVDFEAGDGLSMVYSTSSLDPPGSMELQAGMMVIYD